MENEKRYLREEEVLHRDAHKQESGGQGKGRRAGKGGGGGAKTFRRARAISFLQKLEVQRDALKKQLETTELQTIHPIIVGELKAIETMIAEFIATFELQEVGNPVDNEDENTATTE